MARHQHEIIVRMKVRADESDVDLKSWVKMLIDSQGDDQVIVVSRRVRVNLNKQ